jgi:iron complex outermembrane recepter protein
MARIGTITLAVWAAVLVAFLPLWWLGGVYGADTNGPANEDVSVLSAKQEADKKNDQPEKQDSKQQPAPDPLSNIPSAQQPAPDPLANIPSAAPQSQGPTGLGSSSGTGATSNVTPPSLPTGTDAAAVLANSSAATGVDVQRRSPISLDPRIRGYHVGEVVTISDGAFWTPARIDLDTALGKINSDNIANIEVIKGPYSVRYGAGFALLNIETLPTPRAKEDCFEAHGSTSALYRTNGDGFAGRQSFWGGSNNWGFRIGYDLLASDDYSDGSGHHLPTSYNSQNVDFAIGFDLTENSHLEFKYLRQMQHDVEYPGLLTDINQQNTDGLLLRYIQDKADLFDKLTVEGWYNVTTFNGDSSRAGTRVQIPQLNKILVPDMDPMNPNPGNTPTNPNHDYFQKGGTQVRLDLDTSARLYTLGYRGAVTWGEDKGVQLTVGADITIIHQQYNELDSFNFSIPTNFGIPTTQSVDPAAFVAGTLPLGPCLTLRAGARFDMVTTELLAFGPDANVGLYEGSDTGVGPNALNGKRYNLGSAFGTAEYKLTEELTLSGGYGFAERAPSLTELYTGGAFFGLIQNGLNSIYGNPDLKPEQVNQLDIGIKGNYSFFRAGANGFFSWVQDYITYQPNPFNQPTSVNFLITAAPGKSFPGPQQSLATVLKDLRFKNTSLATLTGFEVFGECDMFCWLTPFANAGYVQGWDQEISEGLPGIAPLEGRVGLRIHDPDKNQRWAVELLARLVDGQELAAFTLGELPTGGFTVFNVRGFWQMSDNVLLTAGVDNLANRTYQEHLDLRTGLGVYQPGINFYLGMKVNY